MVLMVLARTVQHEAACSCLVGDPRPSYNEPVQQVCGLDIVLFCPNSDHLLRREALLAELSSGPNLACLLDGRFHPTTPVVH